MFAPKAGGGRSGRARGTQPVRGTGPDPGPIPVVRKQTSWFRDEAPIKNGA
jgi:hypothetical protein